VKPPPFEFVAARSLEEALAALAEGGDDAKPIAGGQSLVPALNMRLVRPSLLVDLNHAGLDTIVAENGSVHVGATVRQSQLQRAVEAHPLARAALPYVGHVVTRNRGTVGGSIAHADGAAELPLCLVAAGGAVVTDRREIPAAEFFVTHFQTALEAGELVTATTWPAPRPGERFAFAELALRAGDFALAMCAVRVGPDDTVVAVGAVTDRPAPLTEIADLVAGRELVPELAAEAGALASRLVDPPASIHATPPYLKHLTGTLVERALLEAVRP
jgi:CO/xanthine dehydrogenase FAD-binding subunit